MGKLLAYRSSRWFGALGLLATLGVIATGCSFSITEVTRGDVERTLIEQLEIEGVSIRDVRCTSEDGNMEDCLVSGNAELGGWWCAGFTDDQLVVRQGQCNPSNAQLRLQEYEELKEQLERGEIDPPGRVGPVTVSGPFIGRLAAGDKR